METNFEFEKPIILLEKKLEELKSLSSSENVDFSQEIKVLQNKINVLIEEIYTKLTPWQRVQLSRHPNRPYALDYIGLICDDFLELHGDRYYGDDPAMISGFAKISGKSVCIIAQQKGRNTKQKIERNFGMVRPEGYRKALRIMKLASQFSIPILTLIDTPGAYPGVDAEERGQSEAIAKSIMDMFSIQSPIISCVIGEGGSGGALAIGIADRVLMQEYSTYSVISPESCASILWSDSTMNEKAAEIMKMTPEELKPYEVIDGVVKEPKGGAHRDWKFAAEELKKSFLNNLSELENLNSSDLISKRRNKFRTMDHFAYE